MKFTTGVGSARLWGWWPTPGFNDDRNFSAQLAVTLFHDQDVFCDRHIDIRIAANGNDRDLRAVAMVLRLSTGFKG